jgi:hypothetical protein
MPVFDSSLTCMPGLRFWLSGPIQQPGRPLDAGEVSRFSRVQFLDVRMALGLRRACRRLAISLPPVWPSRGKHSVGARYSFFEARFLARRCLCLHFTRHLAAPSARLEVKMVRYSFLVGLFHPHLHAGLSRRLRLLTRAALIRAATVRERSIQNTLPCSEREYLATPTSRVHAARLPGRPADSPRFGLQVDSRPCCPEVSLSVSL